MEGFLDVFCGESLQVGGVTTRKHLQSHHDSSMFYPMVGCLQSLVSIRYISLTDRIKCGLDSVRSRNGGLNHVRLDLELVG